MEINPNSPQPNGSSTPTNALGNIQRPGEYLRQIRLTQKRELEDVAKELRIPLKQLNCLEQDDYKALPEAAFIKGYYRSYAKLLNADASAIIQRFDEIYANDTGLLPNHALKDSPIKMMGKLPGSNVDRNKKWLKRIVVAVIAVLVIWLIVAGLQNWSAKKSSKAEAPAEMVTSNVEMVQPASNVVASSGDQLALNFKRPTSIHIVDSTGKVLATGRQNQAVTLSGQAPFQIRLDDATAVSLSLNQEQISLSPYTVNGKADFRLSR